MSDYDTLIRPIEDRMMRLVWRAARGNREDAEDAFQNAVENIWRRLPRVRNHPNPTALILRICLNCAHDILRRKATRLRKEQPGKLIEEVPDTKPSAADVLMRVEGEQLVLKAIAQLPRRQELAILLRFVEDYEYSDIAQVLGCTESSARKHVERGRRQLENLIGLHCLRSAEAELLQSCQQ